MNAQIDRKQLLDAVKLARRGISNTATLPVLSHVRIETRLGMAAVRVAGSDLELTASSYALAEIHEEGAVLLPCKMVEQILRKMKGERVTIETTGAREATVSDGRSSYTLTTCPLEDYPTLPDVGASSALRIGAAMFRGAVEQVLPAASTDFSRQVLTGVSLELAEDGGATMAATDSYRLAIREFVGEWIGTPWQGSVIVPARVLKETLRLLKGAGHVTIHVHEEFVTVRVAGAQFTGRAVDGQFPNWRQLIPAPTGNVLEAPVSELAEAIERVALMARNDLPVSLDLNGAVVLRARTPDVGEATETLSSAAYRGDAVIIAFNPDFLAQGISGAGDNVSVQVTDTLKPALITGDDPSYRYLLMPVRLS